MTGIILVYADAQREPLVQEAIADKTLENGDSLYVYDDGIAEGIILSAGSVLQARGGVSAHICVNASSSASVPAGVLKVYEEAMAKDVTVAGALMALGGSCVEGAALTGNASMVATSGELSDIRLEGTSKFNIIGGTLDGCSLGTGCSGVLDGNVVAGNITIHSGASMVLGSGVAFFGTVSIGEVLVQNDVTNALSATADFLLKEVAPGNGALVDWSKCAFGGVALTVSATQAAGEYALAENAAGFAATASLQCGEYAAMELSVGNGVAYHNSVYTLSLTEGALAVTAADFETAASADALSWDKINGAAGYALEIAKAEEAVATAAVAVATQSVDLLGLANGNYGWRVRNAAETDNWQDGEAFTRSGAAPEEPQLLEAETNGAADLFFVTTDGVWDEEYVARHVGSRGGWSGTGERVALAGKLRVTDIFAGSDDASILLLDAFASGASQVPEAAASGWNGVALFLDDIYSETPSYVPDATASGRLSRIDTIVGSAGSDLIDLTSQNFEFDGKGVTVLGGDGEDVIWAGAGKNVLVGGAGNDSIVCGGDLNGEDICCFGEEWGADIVTQRDGGKVMLWFAEGDDSKWDEATLTYTDGANKVTVCGEGVIVERRYGAAVGHEAEYARLAAMGVFN